MCHSVECRCAECRYDECNYAECHYAECRYVECHYTECRFVECHYAECRYAECRYDECRGAFSIHYKATTTLSMVFYGKLDRFDNKKENFRACGSHHLKLKNRIFQMLA